MQTKEIKLSSSLEDYLETVFRLVQKHGFARVKDIAKQRSVRAASVTTALKRLADLDLLDYVQREYVRLTPKGEAEARRIFAKHRLLQRFFADILRMPPKEADSQACAIEHSLSAEAMDRLAGFFEFLACCPKGIPEFLDMFHSCPLSKEGRHDGRQFDANMPEFCLDACPFRPTQVSKKRALRKPKQSRSGMSELSSDRSAGFLGKPAKNRQALASLLDLANNDQAKVMRVVAPKTIRQRLLRLGLIPETIVEVKQKRRQDLSVCVSLDGTMIWLKPNEARAIKISL